MLKAKLMCCDATCRPVGKLLLAVAVITVGSAETVYSAVKSWNTGNGGWSAAGNWSPAGAPVAGDTVQIGPHAAAANSTVTMGVNGVAGSLTLTDGMTLQTTFGSLQIAGLTQVAGQNVVGPTTFRSRLLVQNALAGIDFQTDDLSLTNSGQVILENDGALLVADTATLALGTELRGHGWGYFGGGSDATLINDGRIEASGGILRLLQTAAGRLDLDGANGGGGLQVHEGARLEISGDEMLDAFNGVIEMELDTQLAMNLSNGWRLAPSGEIIVTGQPSELTLLAARIEGNPVELAGSLHVTEDGGNLNIASDATLTTTFIAQIDAGDGLEFGGEATIQGGVFNVDSGGSMSFTGATSLSGGVFSTAGTAPTAGLVSFYGATTWQGAVTLNGRSRIAGNAVVAAVTTINADQFDMDGTLVGGNVWDLNAPLTVNADQIEAGVSNSFDGVINVSGGILNKLTINLSDPGSSWRMNGTMNLSGLSGVYFTRVAGSRIAVSGSLNIANADIDVSADVAIEAGGSVNFAAVGSDLRLSGASTIVKGAGFTGQGLLHNNSADGGMTIADGVSFGQAGLDNAGRLRLGDDGPGQVFVDRFTSHAAATLEVAVQGTTPGTEISHLLVTGGTATLAGTLAPSITIDGGSFQPEAGDVFTIITAPGGIIGQFDSLVQPIGLPTGLLFELQYTPISVSLFVDTTFEADFDRDGDVDGDDLTVWNSSFGLNNGGDATHDSTSDGSDFLVWQRQHGAGVPVATAVAASVPEPTTSLLVTVAWLSVVAFRSLRGRRHARVVHVPAIHSLFAERRTQQAGIAFPIMRCEKTRRFMRPLICPGRLMHRQALVASISVPALLAVGTALTHAKDFTWNATFGSWADVANWSPVGTPSTGDNISIDNNSILPHERVRLSGGLYGYDYLEVRNGMWLDTDGGELVSFGLARIMGDGSLLIARPGAGPNIHDFQGQLQIDPEAGLVLVDDVAVRLFDNTHLHGSIFGRGSILLASTEPQEIDGTIEPEYGGGEIEITAGPGSSIDLGRAYFQLVSGESQLTVNAVEMTSDFVGDAHLGPGAVLQMNMNEGWTLASELWAIGGNKPANASVVSGGELRVAGQLRTGLNQAVLRVTAPTRLLETAIVKVAENARIEFEGETVVNAGSQVDVDPDGVLRFDGHTNVGGGTFTTPSNQLADGFVNFAGPTSWHGVATIDGTAQQNGDATVTGGLGAVINAERFDMDGSAGDTVWDVNANLVINAGSISGYDFNHQHFHGVMNVEGGLAARVTVNLADTQESWTMAGELNLVGHPALSPTRLAGSPLVVAGGLNVTGGRVRVNSDLTLANDGVFGPAEVSIDTDSELRLYGRTLVGRDADFTGDGLLWTDDDAYLFLQAGVDSGDVGVFNGGTFEIEHGAGIASVGRFENGETGVVRFDVGGYLAGVEFDQLLVNGAVVLDGQIEVGRLDFNNGFEPVAGDTFTIISSLLGVSGRFLDDHPVTKSFGRTYQWSVIYNPNDVQLMLRSATIPEPASLAMVAIASLGFVARRRSQRRVLR